MKTIPYNGKLTDFFRRNTGRKPSIMKAWKRGEQLLVLLVKKQERMNRNEGNN